MIEKKYSKRFIWILSLLIGPVSLFILLIVSPETPTIDEISQKLSQFVFCFLILWIVGYLGIFLAMLLWKPLLSSEEARKYIFEPCTPDDEIPRAINLIFVRPYYKMARLIYPDAENETDGKQQGQS